jgi:hypothetical protein
MKKMIVVLMLIVCESLFADKDQFSSMLPTELVDNIELFQGGFSFESDEEVCYFLATFNGMIEQDYGFTEAVIDAKYFTLLMRDFVDAFEGGSN